MYEVGVVVDDDRMEVDLALIVLLYKKTEFLVGTFFV